jgi:rsbT co-antagonist protein RsbR
MFNDFSKYMEILGIDSYELNSRLQFFELTDEDRRRLRELQDFARRYTQEITESLYELILAHPETRSFFPDQQTINKVKTMQNRYFMELFTSEVDLSYVQGRLRVGAVHERIGMPPKWYLGAYRRYLKLIHQKMIEYCQQQPEQIAPNMECITKIIFFDMALAIDTYIASHVETMTRHQAAIRELSTPVIKVHERVLLLPIIGTVDTQRAKQIMEAVLTRVVEEQAKVIILDIAGVPVVDTKVADHLIQTTASVSLLGAKTILTGISAGVAKTVVQLGVDISYMNTRASLAEGIDLALSMVGKQISHNIEPYKTREDKNAEHTYPTNW